jgi:diaminohydroxyphosphoribosylaminopyrimidine deaminase/5-amino-6-(5-phosphoribosylamino)uracil reductase
MNDNQYMDRCLQLALSNLGHTYPNPMVGAVIVLNDALIGEGSHEKYGGPHAEVNAVNAVKNTSVLKDATIYVSLEPCSHYGKTPPCADLIIKHQFKRVVIGCQDPFDKVNGSGIEKLKAAGIEVDFSDRKEAAIDSNTRFFTFHQKKRPYVILKWAECQNGFIDKQRTPGDTGINWITQKETKALTHQWRAEEDAILIGAKTYITDNPSLTVREAEGTNPKRIILDSRGNLEFSEEWKALNNEDYIIGQSDNPKLKTEIDAKSILDKLYELNIQSVIIEGGRQTLDLFINVTLWDEARILKGVQKFDSGTKAPKVVGKEIQNYIFGKDNIRIIENELTTI